MNAADVMTTNVLSVVSDTSVADAARLMVSNNISA
jgi:CBS domain-containing protein